MNVAPAVCSVPGCDDPPIEEFALPEGYSAVACEPHCRLVESWRQLPTGAPRGSRLIAGRRDFLPPGATDVREVASDPARIFGVRRYGSRDYR